MVSEQANSIVRVPRLWGASANCTPFQKSSNPNDVDEKEGLSYVSHISKDKDKEKEEGKDNNNKGEDDGNQRV